MEAVQLLHTEYAESLARLRSTREVRADRGRVHFSLGQVLVHRKYGYKGAPTTQLQASTLDPGCCVTVPAFAQGILTALTPPCTVPTTAGLHCCCWRLAGVVVGWDKECEREAGWAAAVNVNPCQPFYHVLPDEGGVRRSIRLYIALFITCWGQGFGAGPFQLVG